MKKKGIKVFLFVNVFIVLLTSISPIIKSYYNEYYLNGRTIFIDPGHGGKDNGASFDGILEDYINLKISEYLLEELISLGVNVLISRSGDYDLASMYAKNRKKEDLNKRIAYINSSKPDLFISIHLNTFRSQEVSGAQVFYQNNIKSKKLAKFIQERFNREINKNKIAKLGDYYILNKSLYTGVLVECGFISNEEDRKKLSSDEYQRKVANVIKQGIIDFFKYD